MSALDLFTWAAIVVLTAGSSVVFVWFLRDVRRLFDNDPQPSDPGAHHALSGDDGCGS